MPTTKTIVLDKKQIQEKINRLAYQLYEDFAGEKKIILAGISKNGFVLAKRIGTEVENISSIKVELVEIELNKKNPLDGETKVKPQLSLTNASVAIVDDVLDSGKTLIYALRPFLDSGAKKIRTVVLADRSHKRFPVSADFIGVSIATTLHEHISVELAKGKEAIYLV